jgi:predicted AAA+ superfamily ATPase
MAFLIGPRQVGKTTISKKAKSLTHHFVYLNWDYEADQQLILAGHQAIADRFHLFLAHQDAPIIVFDEIHKYPHWRNFLKGLYDKHEGVKWIVTGSAKLDVFRQGGDSLMGRYFPYHVHPMSVRECVDTSMKTTEISPPQKI